MNEDTLTKIFVFTALPGLVLSVFALAYSQAWWAAAFAVSFLVLLLIFAVYMAVKFPSDDPGDYGK